LVPGILSGICGSDVYRQASLKLLTLTKSGSYLPGWSRLLLCLPTLWQA